MRLALLLTLCLVPAIAFAEDDGPSAATLAWARETIAERMNDPLRAEDFPADLVWLNVRAPLSLAKELKGKVVLLDFWTYCCINCMHVLPDLEYLETKYADKGLAVVGVHSAKFTNERGTQQIREAIRRYEIRHPVVNDRDFAVWRAYGARSWPSFAILAPDGTYVGRLSGEGRREELEALIVALLETFAGKVDTKPLPVRLESTTRPSGPLAYPGKIAVAADGARLWIADSNHNRIVETDAQGKFLRAFGDGERGLRDGAAREARFFRPQGLAVEGGALYVCDTENHALRRVDLASGAVTTVAGTGRQGDHYALIRKGGHGPWPGAKTDLSSPWDIAFVRGTGYVCMAGSHTLWTFDPKRGTVAHFAGDATERRLDAKDLLQAAFAQPSGITWDGSHLYVADSESSSIVRVGLQGGVETIAGGSEDPKDLFHFGDEDGMGLGRRFQHPLAVLFHAGKLYVADSYNHKLKILDRETTEVTTLSDGYAEPGGLAAWDGRLFVADTNDHAIRTVDLDGKRVTLDLQGVPIPQSHVRQGGIAGDWPKLPGTAFLPRRDVRVGGGAGASVTVSLDLPLGWKLTPGAPSALRFEIGQDVVDMAIAGSTTTLRIPRREAGTLGGVLRLLYYVCQEEGTCRVRSAEIPLTIEVVEGAATPTIRDVFEP